MRSHSSSLTGHFNLSVIIISAFCLCMFSFFSVSFAQDIHPPEDPPASEAISEAESPIVISEEEIPRKMALENTIDEEYNLADTLDKRYLALETVRAALKEFPESYGLLWRGARIIWFIGDWLDDSKGDELEKLGLEGLDYANRALKIQPDGLEGHYYKALAISTYSRGISIVKALMKGLGGDYEDNIRYVLQKDETFDRCGALRAMGRYYWKLPWPKYDYKKSLDYLEKAVKIDPTVLRSHLYYADTLWALKKYQQAKDTYEKILKSEPAPHDVRDNRWVREQTQKQLKKLIEEEF